MFDQKIITEEIKNLLEENERILWAEQPNRKIYVQNLNTMLFMGFLWAFFITALLLVKPNGYRGSAIYLLFAGIAFFYLPTIIIIIKYLQSIRKYKEMLFLYTNKRLMYTAGLGKEFYHFIPLVEIREMHSMKHRLRIKTTTNKHLLVGLKNSLQLKQKLAQKIRNIQDGNL